MAAKVSLSQQTMSAAGTGWPGGAGGCLFGDQWRELSGVATSGGGIGGGWLGARVRCGESGGNPGNYIPPSGFRHTHVSFPQALLSIDVLTTISEGQ
jgi:hypothetical protein